LNLRIVAILACAGIVMIYAVIGELIRMGEWWWRNYHQRWISKLSVLTN